MKEKDIIWKRVKYTKIIATVDPIEKANNVTVKYETVGKLLTISEKYSILQTDYKTYAIVWGCNKILGIPNEKVFILGREKTLSDAIIHSAFDLLDSLNLKRRRLEVTVQDECVDM